MPGETLSAKISTRKRAARYGRPASHPKEKRKAAQISLIRRELN
jgi:hypothetical protein